MISRARRPAWAATAALAALGLVLLQPAAALAGPPTRAAKHRAPALIPMPGATRPGSTIIVQATNFPVNIDVLLQVCGDGGIAGSGACALSSTATVATTQYGTFRSYFVVGKPPVPCPCVIEAVSLELETIVNVPIRLIGFPVAPVRPVVPSTAFESLSIRGVAVSGSGPWTAWFGGHPQRQLVVTVANTGGVPLHLPPLIVHVGAVGTTPLDVGTSPFGELAPHTTRRYSVAIGFGLFASGSYVITADFAGLSGAGTHFTIDTSMLPFGAFAVGVLLAILVVGTILYVVLTRRRRRPRAEPPEGAASPQEPQLPGEPDEPAAQPSTGEAPVEAAAAAPVETADPAPERPVEVVTAAAVGEPGLPAGARGTVDR